MSKDIIYFAETICGIKLVDWQKDLLRQMQEANDKGELILIHLGRRQGGQLLNNILINFQIWSKTQQIADLEAKLAQHEKHNAWVQEFLDKYQIDTELTPEYSENPIIEYCEQVEDFRAVDNKIIEDLQNELAESEKQIKHLRDWLDDEILTSVDHESYYDTINEYEEEIKQLKQQLSEKEKEIKDLNTRIFLSQLLQTPEEQRLKIIGNSCCQYNPNQDKISFAVDILEELADCSNYINSKLDFECGSYVSEKAIRDKIKYLKGKKDE